MAAVNRRSRVLEGESLEFLVECCEEAYASEPQRYKNTACTACFGPLLTPVAVVERATWEAQFQLAAWNELGRDWRLSNAAKSFKLSGFPSALLATWVTDIGKKCREPSLKAWDREYPSVKYCERGNNEKPGVGRLVRGYVFLTIRAIALLFEQAKLPGVELLIQQAGTWGFPEPALRPGGRERLAANGNYSPIRDPMHDQWAG
eukprot:jgi/Tetstr1/427494/TSEL_017620.t1